MSEQISTLLDGELAREDFSKEISAVLSNKKAMQTWRDYQTVGDVMRAAPSLSESFTARLMDKIELEPTVLAPNALPRAKPIASKAQEKSARRLPMMWSMAASCAAVLVVGWAMVNQSWQAAPQTAPEVATMQLAQGSDAQPQHILTAQRMNASIAATSVATSEDTASDKKTAHQQSEQPVIAMAETGASDAPMEYLAAHHASAPSISSYYIQTPSFSE